MLMKVLTAAIRNFGSSQNWGPVLVPLNLLLGRFGFWVVENQMERKMEKFLFIFVKRNSRFM